VPKLKTLEQLFKEKGGYEIVGELPGSEMIGWSYDGPFDELPAQAHPAGYPAETAAVVLKQRWGPERPAKEIHRVVAWADVGEKEGTGIVHIAPGCGKEDFVLAKKEGLVPIAPLDDYGQFLPGFGELAGKSAVDTATTDWILANLQHKGILLAVEKYPHSYPHCWRCKTELLFRLVDEWFINMSWREEIMKVCHDIRWIPEFGLQRELDWLKNMGDWMISKKRFWGLALPIWVCARCNAFEVIGGREQLKQRAVAGWQDFEGHSPHRPWIDLVKTKCPQCGGQASRIPDVGNPWLDAGIVSYSTMGYNRDRPYWEKWFPADFITESLPGQFRNWFYALLAMSTMMTQRAPFKVLLGHGLVRDEHGEEMHKSRGNAIPFEGAADEGWVVTYKDGRRERKPPIGADLMRWLFCRQNPVNNINFGSGPAEELRSKFTLKLWNTYAFFCNYARLDEFDSNAPQVPVARRPDIDRWILSDLQLLTLTARREYERFNVMAFCLEAEQFLDDRLSNWYIRRNRRRFWKSEKGIDKQAAYQTLYTVLTTLAKLFAPIMPFLSEAMYQNLVVGKTGERRSVHWCDFPEADESLLDAELSAEMDALLRLVSVGSAARNSAKIKVRQPLAEMRVQPANEQERRAVERFASQICEELNIKRVTLHESKQGPLLRYEIKPNMKTLGPKFGPRLKSVIAALAAMEPAAVAERLGAGQAVELACFDGVVTVEPADVIAQFKASEGWVGVADRGTQILVDTRITEALAREGMAREVVRHVQNARKDANLNMEDRIVLSLQTQSAALSQAIEAHKDYICNETLAVRLTNEPLGGEAYRAEVKVDGQPLNIELRNAA
jgi:isoleucyl-tRNA synthetase